MFIIIKEVLLSVKKIEWVFIGYALFGNGGRPNAGRRSQTDRVALIQSILIEMD